MKLVLAETKHLKDAIGIISELVTEGKFTINKDGMELIAMDPANVAMVVFKLFSSSFIDYSIDKEMELGINLTSLKEIFRRVMSSDTMTLETDGTKLKIILTGKSKRTFSLPIIDIEENDQKVPDLSFKASLKIDANLLSNIIDDVEIVSESVTFLADKDKLIIEGSGDLKDAKVELTGDEIISSSVEEKSKAKYSVEYLKKMVAGNKLTNEVSMSFSNNYPLKIEFKEVDKVLLSFILAPRVENY